ncbi:MAG: hypothetical protein O8C63_08735 [Candidatus Methanoperedens sp.]|nr:hypothetical protein [Candidatus Methanoperedens sp.]
MVVDERIFDFMVEIAWKGIEGTQNSIIGLENKAYNMISLSGIFIAAIIAVLVGVTNLPKNVSIFLIYELFILILCAGCALGTIWLRKQELLDIYKVIDTINFADINKTKGNFVTSMELWQEEGKKISKNKSLCLKLCMILFLIALVFGLLFAMSIFYFSNKVIFSFF